MTDKPSHASHEQVDSMVQGFNSLDNIVDVEYIGAGMKGELFTLHSHEIPIIHVEDVELNCEWDIVKISDNVYTADDWNYTLIAEVRRWPTV